MVAFACIIQKDGHPANPHARGDHVDKISSRGDQDQVIGFLFQAYDPVKGTVIGGRIKQPDQLNEYSGNQKAVIAVL